MRLRAASVVSVLLVGVLAGPSGAGRPKVRMASAPYTGALAALVGTSTTPNAYVGDCDPNADSGCVRFEIRRGERYLTLKVEDQTGLPVYAVAFAPDGSEVGEVCGSSDEPIAAPGGYVDVWVTAGACYGSTSPSLPTTGTVQASFASKSSAL